MQKYLKVLVVRLVMQVFVMLAFTAVLNIVTGQTQNYWALLVTAWLLVLVSALISIRVYW